MTIGARSGSSHASKKCGDHRVASHELQVTAFLRRCPIGTYKRLPRGKQKKHNEFRDWTFHALVWVKNNWQTSLEIVAVAAVALGVVIGASTYWQLRSEGAAEKLYAAVREAAGSPSEISKLEDVASDYSRTPAGREAMMMLGGIYLERKDYDKAIEEFKKLAGRSRNHPMLLIAALHRIAESQLAKGDPKGAAETYLKAASDPSNIIGPESRFRAAAAFEAAGDADRAASLYMQVIEDAKEEDRATRAKAEERLIWMTAENTVR